ncbi:hypothetical protein ACFLYK_00515 [Candidatus Cloacimonadota bacterium]
MKTILTLIMILVQISSIFARINLNNELSVSVSVFTPSSSQIYHRKFNYKPELLLPLYNKDNKSLDSKIIGNLYHKFYRNDKKDITRTKIEFYRVWLRLFTEQSEIRVGRQKINFGSAMLLRSLRWFDKLDPRDPQQNTPGVDALLFRYYFLNNSTFWTWILLADKNTKGNEMVASSKNSFEFGGRLQYPFEYCEAAISFHTRELELENEDQVMEYRLGIDSRWDSFMGYWLELSVGYFSNTSIIPDYEKSLTLGADYSLPWGNSIYLLAEHLIHSVSEEELFTSSSNINTSALNVEYPLSFFSSLNAIIFYNWDSREISSFLMYNYSLDYIDLYFSLNLNPDIEIPDYDNIYYDGASFQIKAVYNFDI